MVADMSRNHDLIYFPDFFPGRTECIIVEKGEKVVASGTWPHYVYVVKEGIASVQYVSGKGRSVEASQFLVGDFIGEMNAICSQPFIFDAVACTRMVLLKIPAGDFISAMKSDFRLVQSMVQSQNNRINYLEAFCVINNTFTLYEKVVLYLCCRFTHEEEAKSYTKSFMAAMLGCELRSLNRVLADLRQNHLIRIIRGRIHVMDYAALMREAEAHDIDSQIEVFYEYITDRRRPSEATDS